MAPDKKDSVVKRKRKMEAEVRLIRYSIYTYATYPDKALIPPRPQNLKSRRKGKIKTDA